MKNSIMKAVAAGWLTCLLISSSAAETIDAAWVMSQMAQMRAAIASKDDQALKALQRTIVERSKGTKQEYFALQTLIQSHIEAQNYEPVGKLMERLLDNAPELIGPYHSKVADNLAKLANAAAQAGDLSGALSLDCAQVAIFATFRSEQAGLQVEAHYRSYLRAGEAQKYALAADALARIAKVPGERTQSFKAQMKEEAALFLPFALCPRLFQPGWTA